MAHPDDPKQNRTLILGEDGTPVGGGPPPPGDDDESGEDRLVGQILMGKWKVLKKLGAGSFGTVYKVEDLKGGWIEALKVLGVDRLTGAEAETARKRFLREAQIMKRLGAESSHIVGLSTYEEDLEAGLIYFVMEFVQGRSLADVLEEDGPLDVDRLVPLALQVCEALSVAHRGAEPVVHRDLKLENLMLTKDPSGADVVKVLDFGIAKIAEREADSRLTTVGTLGTPGYAAPEQLRAEPVDGRTDLFAFGVILYSLLTGRDPWLGNHASQPTSQIYDLMVATERGDVRPMDPSVPAAMRNIVMRLLRRDPDQRFATAEELREALLRVQAGGEAENAGWLRVLTDEAGVEVQVRSGLRTVAEGKTPLSPDALPAGSYRIVVRDPRFEPVETSVVLTPGAMEDVTVLTTPRAAGMGAAVRRKTGWMAAAAVLAVLAAGALVVRPWGRTLPMDELRARAAAGGVDGLRLSKGGMEGTLPLGPLAAPFRTPVAEEEMPAVVETLRQGGVEVDASWLADRLVRGAAEAQARRRYFGQEDDVRSYAERLAALDPERPEARSLLLKVAERMAWDAEAALADGAPESARGLLRDCLALVPDHARCAAAAEGM